jgi:hypothetical protein
MKVESHHSTPQLPTAASIPATTEARHTAAINLVERAYKIATNVWILCNNIEEDLSDAFASEAVLQDRRLML